MTSVINTCSPENVYGPLEQWLFLGCSVRSFSASVGWNEQSADVTVQLVQDACTAPAEKPKHYMNSLLVEQTTTAPDPGFLGETYNIIGSPVYFRLGEFEFSGLVQSWEEQRSADGRPTYLVKLTDPRQILEGTQLIINEYAGPVGNHYNIFNVFGYMESFGVPCPQHYQSAPGLYVPGDGGIDGAVFGTPAQAFGGAHTNENGMQWNRIVQGFNVLANATVPVTNDFSPHGRLVYAGVPGSVGYGIMPADRNGLSDYLVDLSEIPDAPSYWRMNGVNITLMDAINQVLEESGYDYYVELLPVSNIFAFSGIMKIIKIRTVARGSQPDLGAIGDFIDGLDPGAVSTSQGRELRNEITSAFVVGGPKQTFYQAEQDDNPDGEGDDEIVGIELALVGDEVVGRRRVDDGADEIDDMILPFFGLDENGDIIVPEKNANDEWEFEAETWGINEQLQLLQLPQGTVTINEIELQFALGSFDAFMSYQTTLKGQGNATDIGGAIPANVVGLFDVNHVFEIMVENPGPQKTHDMVATRKAAFQDQFDDNAAKINEDLQAIFDWVGKFAKDFYGKKFMVRVPFTCAKWDSESERAFTSETPAQDGWTEVATIIGLPNGTALTDVFRNETNKFEAFVRIDGAANKETSSLDPNEYGIVNDQIYIRAQVEEDFIYHDRDKFFGPRVIVTIPQAVQDAEDQQKPKGLKAVNRVIELLDANDVNDLDARLEEAMKDPGGKVLNAPFQLPANIIDAAAFGMASNIMTYGPWTNAGVPGQTRVEHQEGLVPWEYGGYEVLNLAGQTFADEGVTNMQVGEMGSVKVPGYPTLPLGAELGALAGGAFGGGTHLIENRNLTEGVFNGTLGGGQSLVTNFGTFNFGFSWGGVYGPNITDISVSTTDNDVSTTYSFRTYTPKVGRFARANAERLKQVGQNRANGAKQIRAFILQRFKREQLKFQLADRRAKFNEGVGNNAQTPHGVLVGNLTPWLTGDGNENYSRPAVISSPVTEIPNEMQGNYGSKAMMSLDGLLRPVSMDGDGGLPQYAQKNLGCYKGGPREAIPPVYPGDCDGGVTGVEIYNDAVDVDYLNPFSNPQGYQRSAVSVDKSMTPDIGHDIEIVARTGAGSGDAPESGMVMPIAGYKDETTRADYENDYRMLAMRGPIIMQSWGYDENGRPVPNRADTYANASTGVFTEDNLECYFMDDWLRKSETWPVGPIDLRWDRKRACWTAPPSHKIMKFTLCDDLPANGSASGTVDLGTTVNDCNGNPVTPMIEVTDCLGMCMASGDSGLAQYDTHDCKYYVMTTKTNDVFMFKTVDCFPYNGPGSGIAVSGDGETPIQGASPELFYTNFNDPFGPLPSGYVGWAQKRCDENGETKSYIIAMEQVAEFIEFVTISGFAELNSSPFCNNNWRTGASYTHYWDGNPPEGEIVVTLPSCYEHPECFGAGTKGVAVRDTRSLYLCGEGDSCDKHIYNIIELDTTIKPWSRVHCTTDGVNEGSLQPIDKIIQALVFSTGIDYQIQPVSGDICGIEISAARFMTCAAPDVCPTSDVCTIDNTANNNQGEINKSLAIGNNLIAHQTSNCAHVLHAQMKILAGLDGSGQAPADTGDCVPSTVMPNGGAGADFIKFGYGLNVRQLTMDDVCGEGVEVSANANIRAYAGENGSGSGTPGSGDCVPSNNLPSGGASAGFIKFGRGFNVQAISVGDENDNCGGGVGIEVGLATKVGGHFIDSIEVDDCLSLSISNTGTPDDPCPTGEAIATIGFANTISPTSVEYVTQVECSGSGESGTIVTTTQFMNFNACGQLVSTSESALF